MADYNIMDLLGVTDLGAQSQASALADAIRGKRAIAALGAIGSPAMQALGSQYAKDAEAESELMQRASGQRAQQGHQRLLAGITDAMHRAQLAEQARHNKATEALAAETWTTTADPVTGGFLQTNKQTGEYRLIAPTGGKPGEGPRPKPKDLENDVQAYGKDVEPIAKVQTDLGTLRGASAKGNVAGFGPIAGRVPNMLSSDEAIANRQAAARIMAGIIQMTSGQAASEKEVERLLKANGLGPTATDSQIREGVSKLAGQYDLLATQRKAKYHPAVVETFEARGGYKPRLDSAAPLAQQSANRKQIKGKWYEQRADGWYEVD